MRRSRYTTLGACCDIVSGATPSTTESRYWDGNVEWATPKDLSNLDGKYIARTARRITERGLASCAATLLPPYSVLFSSRAPIGHVAINVVPMATNQGFKSFVPKPGEVDSNFLYHWLRANRPYLESLGNGATFKEVSKAVVSRVEIFLPPISEQRRLAAILDKADAIRRMYKEAIALTEDLLRSAFLKMFGDPVTNPKGWPRQPLGELATIRRGASPRPIERYMGGRVPWIKIGDATGASDIYLSSTAEFVTEEGARKSVRLSPGALIVANSGVSLGFARVLKIEGCIHDGWLALEDLHERLRKIYLVGLINLLTPYFRRLAPEGTQPNLNTNLMRSFDVPLPPTRLQDEYERVVSKLSHVTADLRGAASKAEGLFSSLAQQAFSTNAGALAC